MKIDNEKTVADQLMVAHDLLLSYNLVQWSQGNVSVVNRAADEMTIKASGVPGHYMYPDHMLRVRLSDGYSHHEYLRPSTDTETHRFIYNSVPDCGAIVHTHSQYATAFAARGSHIPCALTGMADDFGGRIPCLPYCEIGGTQIGTAIVKYLEEAVSGYSFQVMLIRNHGVFVIGKDLDEAVKLAVMAEDAARTVYTALTLNRLPLRELPKDEIVRAHEYHKQHYGNRASPTPSLPAEGGKATKGH